MKKTFNTQVCKDCYFNIGNNPERFISYFYQIKEIVETNPISILEIGVGNKIVCNFFKEKDINITTCDFDKSLKPDVLADIRHLPFSNKQFDTVVAFEVLEHLPWNDFKIALKELNRVSKNFVLISIPYACFSFELFFKVETPLFKKILRLLSIKVPNFIIKAGLSNRNKEHYWEMGKKGYSKSKIRKELKEIFIIDKEFQPILNSYHYFFILKKK